MNAPAPTHPTCVWSFAGRRLEFGPPTTTMPLLMGIVNTTPDSFSDGGEHLAAKAAVDHALRLIDEGSDIIDIGGQSTRPGAEPVSLEQELSRVLPAIEALRQRSEVLISIDTSKAEVARQAIAAGAQIINDVTSLRDDPAMLAVVAGCDAGVVLMHMLGTPKTMQDSPSYRDVVAEVREFLAERAEFLAAHGVTRDRIAIDPGLGFGKSTDHNLRLLHGLPQLAEVGFPICIGPSRKRLVGKITGRPIRQRAAGTAGVCVCGYLRGAHILRVHDVGTVRDAVAMAHAIERSGRQA